MSTATPQLAAWDSKFGQAYTDRNLFSTEELDQLWERSFGVRKSAIFRELLTPERLGRGRVLEVGCNVGIQLRLLQGLHPGLDLYGLDPQAYALAKARQLSPDITFVTGNAFAIPFRDGLFDVVMTNNMLIHIQPSDLPRALAEIYRCSGRYIFLYEYFADQPTEVPYRGEKGLLWKMNYAGCYLAQFPDLVSVAERRIRYADPAGGPDLVDQVCLLEKRART